jgi:pimeloyl-ACP methyl ester carboxylesterase
MTLNLTEYSFKAGPVTLNYVEGPDTGPPLVLLHGGSARWQAFESIMPELAARWHLYGPDLRGHGRSDRAPADRYRLQDYSADIIAFLQGPVSEPAFLVGHSLGGIVALLVVAYCPQQVRAVVVGDSPLTAKTWQTILQRQQARLAVWRDLAGGQRPLEEIAEALKNAPVQVSGQDEPKRMREVMGEDSPVFRWLAIRLYQNDPAMLAALLDDFEAVAAGYEMEQLLPAIRCPVLLLQADPATGGLMTDVEVAQALTLLAQPAHVKLNGLSHVLHHEQKEPVLQAIIEFLTIRILEDDTPRR